MTTLIEALTTITELTKSSEPMTTFITREVNLYLDVLRVYGKRDKLTETDVHILCARLLDLAQIAPLSGEPAPGQVGMAAVGLEYKQDGTIGPIPIPENEKSPVLRMYAPKRSKASPQAPTEAQDEARL